MRRRVVITGLGVVTSLGEVVDEYWAALCAGRSGRRSVVTNAPADRVFELDESVAALVTARADSESSVISSSTAEPNRTVTNTAPTTNFRDANATNLSSRFYRAILP